MSQTKSYIKSIYQIFLISAFLFMVGTPATIWIFSSATSISKSENRSLAQAPRLIFKKEELKNFSEKFESYFNDQFGLRSDLIYWNNFFSALVFYELPKNSQQLMGKNYWTFYKGDNTLLNHRGLDPFSRQELIDWQSKLEQRHEWLAEMNIKYLFVIAPDKSSVYPEQLPPQFTVISKNNRMDQLIEHFERNSFLKILDLRKTLLNKKADYILYSYSGTHWNSYGSYFAYCRLIEEIKKWYPEEKPMPLSHFKKVVRVNSDSLMHALGLTKFIPEPSKITHLLLSSPSSRVVKNVRKENKGETRISDKGNIRALVFGDSFYDKLSPLMAEHFSYVYRPNKSIPEMNLMKKLISDEKPDIFIEQRVERYLNTYP